MTRSIATTGVDMTKSRRLSGDCVVVLGMIMAVVGIIDVVWGLGTAALGEELLLIAGELESNQFQMMAGGFVRMITLGVFNLSGVETGEHARQLLAMLPRPDYLVEVGWIRAGFAMFAILLGTLLAARRRWVLIPVMLWASIGTGWSVWVTWRSWGVLTDGIGDPWQGESLPLFIFELVVHFVWPVVLVVALLARRNVLKR